MALIFYKPGLYKLRSYLESLGQTEFLSQAESLGQAESLSQAVAGSMGAASVLAPGRERGAGIGPSCLTVR